MAISGARLGEPIQVRNLLRAGLETGPDDDAVIAHGARLTWRELEDSSTRLAANLIGLGLEPGDRVASLMPNRVELVLHYLACIKAGLVATPLNYRYMAPEIDHALEVSGAATLLAHTERDADLAKSKLVGELPLGVIRYGAAAGASRRIEELIGRNPPDVELSPLSGNDPACIFFTSGSTGLPKGVTHTAETLGWMIASFAESAELTAEDTLLPGSSWSHIFAFIVGLAGLSVGGRVVVTRSYDADELLPLLREDRPTVLSMLPSALFSLVRDHGAVREDFRSLRLLLAGGDKVAEELEREFTELTGSTIDELYGMTEFGCSNINPPSGVNKLGSIGRMAAGFEGEVRDDERNPLPTGRAGRLWIKARSNMIGYWDNEEATDATIVDGWLDTGDMMEFDQDGYLWFRGRKKQLIIHDGSNISPQEVEGALLEHPAIQEAGVVGFHHLIHGENVRAYVSLREGAKRPTSQELIRFARERVGYKAPEEIVFLKELPLNATGKVDRVVLKRIAEEQHQNDPIL